MSPTWLKKIKGLLFIIEQNFVPTFTQCVTCFRDVDEDQLQAICSSVAQWLTSAKDGDKLDIQESGGSFMW